MKNLFILLALLFLMSCEKEDELPTEFCWMCTIETRTTYSMPNGQGMKFTPWEYEGMEKFCVIPEPTNTTLIRYECVML